MVRYRVRNCRKERDKIRIKTLEQTKSMGLTHKLMGGWSLDKGRDSSFIKTKPKAECEATNHAAPFSIHAEHAHILTSMAFHHTWV